MFKSKLLRTSVTPIKSYFGGNKSLLYQISCEEAYRHSMSAFMDAIKGTKTGLLQPSVHTSANVQLKL